MGLADTQMEHLADLIYYCRNFRRKNQYSKNIFRSLFLYLAIIKNISEKIEYTQSGASRELVGP